MRDRQRGGPGGRELRDRQASGQPHRDRGRRSPTLVRDHGGSSTIATLSTPCIVRRNAVRVLVSPPTPGLAGDQMALCEGESLLALGGLCSRFVWSVRAGFEEDLEAPRAKGLLAHEAAVVYRG